GDNDPDGDNNNMVITEVDGTPISVGNPVTLSDGSVVTLNPDGTLSVTPPNNDNDPISFTYTVEDEDGLTDQGQVDITFAPCPFPTDSDGDGLTDCEETTGIDDPSTPTVPTGTSDENDPCDPISANCFPVANNDGGTTDPGVDVIIDVTGNDTDPDGTINIASIDLDPDTPGQQSSFTVPGEGTFTDNGDGTVTFSPETGYNDGTTVINYVVFDNDGNPSNEATITVVVPICTSTVDSDGDGLTDCEETTGIDDPSTPTVPTGTSDENDPCSPVGINTTDSDGDGLTDCEETTGIDD
ncbi:Ig-like domain-containing protein, partial [Algibacter sp. PT7-4]|uniref:Ig-like domain-containing protein n=1 Tax=Algibacter ulvanivorans TaxID=3400999 RepID=UPI003AB057EE